MDHAHWILISGLCLSFCEGHPQSITWYDAGDDSPFTFSLVPSGKPNKLRGSNGKVIRPKQIEYLYGRPGGIRILDDGIDIASQLWAGSRNFTQAREVVYQDLSDRAGWPDVTVPSGTIALDPINGRLKFSEGDTQQPLELVHSVPLPTGEPVGVALKGHHAFFVSKKGHRTLQIIDLKNPTKPSLVAHMIAGDIQSPPQIRGDYLALSAGREGFKLINIADPRRPEIVWEFHPKGLTYAGRFIFCGNLMYVKIFASPKHPTDLSDVGWHVFDVSDIRKPRKLGFLPARWIKPAKHKAEVIRPESNLRRAGSEEIIPTFFHNGLAYQSEKKNLHVLDLSDPFRPVITRTFRLPEPVRGLYADGYLLHAFLRSGKIATIFHGRHFQKLISVAAVPGTRWPKAIHGDLLVASAFNRKSKSSQIRVYRMKNSASFSLLAALDANQMRPIQIVVNEGLVTVVDEFAGLWSFDLKQTLKQASGAPKQTIRLAVNEPGELSKANAGLWFSRELIHRRLHMAGRRGILSSFWGSFVQIDASHSAAPKVSGIWRTGASLSLPFKNHLVHRKYPERFYRTFDLSNPNAPREVAQLREPVQGTPIRIGEYLYLFTDAGKKDKLTTSLAIYDFHEPSFPYRVQASKRLPEGFSGPFVSSMVRSGRLFLVKTGGLIQADVSDPLRPRFIGRLDDSKIRGRPHLTMHGKYLYMSHILEDDQRKPELLIFDVSAGSPVRVANFSLNTGGEGLSVTSTDHRGGAYTGEWRVEGDFLYGISYWGGVRVYDIGADPLKPTLLDKEHAAFEQRFNEWRSGAKSNTGVHLPGRHQVGTTIGSLHRDHLILPKRAALNSYRVRRSPEEPSGPLSMQFVPEQESFKKAIAHVRGAMLALDEASAGAVIVRQKGKTLVEWYEGRHTHDPESRPVDAQSRFPIWSLTKTFAATGLGLLLDRGIVRLNDPVQRYIPEFKGKGKERITFRHLATHTSGLPGSGDWREVDLVYEPDAKKGYSNAGIDLLAYSIGKLMGEAGFGQTLQKHVFGPLGMRRSGFLLPDGDTSLLIPALTTRDSEPWYDEWGPDGRGMAGLYMTPRDLAAYGEMLLNEGRLYGRRILAASTVRTMVTPQMQGKAAKLYPYQGLGWHIKGPWKFTECPSIAPDGSYSHGGGTHCMLFVCPARNLVAAKLLNRGYWPNTFDYSGDYRRFIQLVLEAVEDD